LVELGMVVGADAEPNPGAPDRGEIGAVEILLPEMDEIAPLLDGEAPVVVDDELRLVPGAEVARPADLGAEICLWAVLGPELHEPDAERQGPGEPAGIGEDRVEAGKRHSRKALPISGVEGAAISRGSIGSALRASRPASIASATARAMATGSPARAPDAGASTRRSGRAAIGKCCHPFL
jgi:hypothetical protein